MNGVQSTEGIRLKGWPGVRISGTVSAAEWGLKALEDVRKMTPEGG